MPEMTDLDIDAAAAEIKKHLDNEKMNLIDYSLANIECWFSTEELESGDYPQIAKFTAHWKDMFDYADGITDADGAGFPNEEFVKLEAKLKEIEDKVNGDAEYWKKLREEVIPLYEKSPQYKQWQKRWKAVELFYDPIGMDVTTTEIFTHVDTGAKTRGKVVRQRTIPEGIVIRVDKKKKKADGVIKSSTGYKPPPFA
jgi:hypothetical protein